MHGSCMQPDLRRNRMLIKEEFLKKYNIAENEFRSANISFRNWRKFTVTTVPWSRRCAPSAVIFSISTCMIQSGQGFIPTATG